MRFFSRLFQGKKEEREEEIRINVGQKEFVAWQDSLDRDPDARIEEFWIETLSVSEDGYWLLVGRRHGIIQLYDWRGKLHRLPARPPAQVITDAVFRGNYLALLTPPYLVLYYIQDKRHTESWKSIKFSQEGIRPSSGLDIRRSILAFGTVGERIYTIQLTGDMSLETIEFSNTFSYREAGVGQLELLRILEDGRFLLSGSDGVAVFDRAGNLIKSFPYACKKAVAIVDNYLLLGHQNKLLAYSLDTYEELFNIDLPLESSQMDSSPDGSLLFIADAKENRLGIFNLRNKTYLQTLQGFGYSVVKVSPDGSIYTCTYKDEGDKRFYYLTKLSTNLVEFYLEPERISKIKKNAESVYKTLQKRLAELKSSDNIEEIKEYKELLSLDAPIREVREIISKGEEELKRTKIEIFVRDLREKIAKKEAEESDLRKLEEFIRVADKESKEKLERVKEELLSYFENLLKETLQKVKDALKEVELKDIRDAEGLEEVKVSRQTLYKLPREMQTKAQEELNKIVQERFLSSRLTRYKIKIEKDKVVFGSEEVEKFSGERRRLPWRLVVEDKFQVNGEVYVRISFERADGITKEPKRYSNILRAEELRHLPKWVRAYLRHLNGLFSFQEYRLPLFVSYEETPWFVQNLERFTSLVKEQLTYQEGVLILEGDAGVGKNFLVEVFSALTGRPLYIVPCNSKMEKEDLTFMYEFDPKKGTKKSYSDLVKALQTPGAVIYFDEINTLPASLVKIFNPLFDYRRYLVLSSGEVIKARHDVILVGGMNPQNYLGVSELPQDIKSRADIMYVDYPPFEAEGGFYYPDEAIILKDQVKELEGLTPEEFTYLWYYVINSIKTDLGEKLYTKEREKKMWELFELLSIANAIRKAYRAYQTQKSEEPVEFVFSIRDTIRCARRLNKYPSAKEAVLETILPKISSPLEREIVREIAERSTPS